MTMKRRAENDCLENDSDEENIFSYTNRQKLTFSGFMDNAYTSFSSDSEESEDGDDVIENLSGYKSGLVKGMGTLKGTVTKQSNKNELTSAILSPSPPPALGIQVDDREKRYIRKDSNRATCAGSRTWVNRDTTISLLKKQLDNTDPLLQDEICVIDIEEISIIQLKIRVHGVVEKYEVKKADPLKNLIADIAKKENVVPGYVTLNLGNVGIDPTETTTSLGLTIADIIECVIHAEDVDKENRINIKIQSANKSSIYNVSLFETVERVLKDFCEKCAANITQSKFSFDGERVNDFKTTYSKLDVIEGDVLDADLK